MTKGVGGDWSTVKNAESCTNQKKTNGPNPGQDIRSVNGSQEIIAGVVNVAGNVSSFLSGIRATFRSENVVVSKPQFQSKSSLSASKKKN